jgi:hypothetical protein
MLKETSSTYFIVGNLTITKDEILNLPDQKIHDIEIDYPLLFKNHTHQKFIKFIGCSLQYMTYDGPLEDFTETVYNPLHTTLHSNIVNTDNTESAVDKSKLVVYEDYDYKLNYNDLNVFNKQFSKPTHINEYTDYILTVNNFFNQKVYKITPYMNKLKFYFIDENGEKVKILQIQRYDREDINPDYIEWYNKNETERDENPPSQTITTPCIYYFQALYNIEMELILGYN